MTETPGHHCPGWGPVDPTVAPSRRQECTTAIAIAIGEKSELQVNYLRHHSRRHEVLTKHSKCVDPAQGLHTSDFAGTCCTRARSCAQEHPPCALSEAEKPGTCPTATTHSLMRHTRRSHSGIPPPGNFHAEKGCTAGGKGVDAHGCRTRHLADLKKCPLDHWR